MARIKSASFHSNVVTVPDTMEIISATLLAFFQNKAATKTGVIAAP